MLQIGKSQEMTWHNLESYTGEMPPDDAPPCVAFKMRQATGLDEAMAETSARAAITNMSTSAVDAKDYGYDNVDWAEAIVEGNVPLFSGVGFQVYAVELAWLCGSEMRGVEGVDGEKPEWSRRNIALVLQSRRPGAQPFATMASAGSTFADTFMALALKSVREARIEGKP